MIDESYIRKRMKLAFLSPKIQKAIMEGTQPHPISIEYLVKQNTIPFDWQEQESKFGFTSLMPLI